MGQFVAELVAVDSAGAGVELGGDVPEYLPLGVGVPYHPGRIMTGNMRSGLRGPHPTDRRTQASRTFKAAGAARHPDFVSPVATLLVPHLAVRCPRGLLIFVEPVTEKRHQLIHEAVH